MTMSDEDERKPLEPQSSDKKPTKGFAAYLVVFALVVYALGVLTNFVAFLHVCRLTKHSTLYCRFILSTGVRHCSAHT